ncbi:hypothetical protein GQ42DRAFT_178996 [Ramicandelaber brevisporus]|nr:hypothetical protein GQ42DRAFT_178996 [Ramicandelaber brevisporus]
MFIPSDVLLEIAAYVEHTDQISMSLVCFAWADALVPKVRSLLVYLVRHSRHAISLKEHLSKHGHLVRELSIGDKKPHNVVALLGFIGAIPFGDGQHSQFTLSKCTGEIAAMLQDIGYNPFSGWQFPFLGLFDPNIWSPNKLRGELTSDWVERLHVINPPKFEVHTWPRLRVLHQEGTTTQGLPSGDGPIPRKYYPVLQRITPFRYDVPLPTGLDKLLSQCTGALRELCMERNGALGAIWWGTRPRPAVTMFEEIKTYTKMYWTSIGNAEEVRVLDIRSLTMNRPSVPPPVRQFFDVIALETPIVSLEYLQISAYPNSTFPMPIEAFFMPARLMAIPDRFPNLRLLKHVHDKGRTLRADLVLEHKTRLSIDEMFIPSDVLLEIAAYVEHTDQISMSLVCFAWADALVPKVRSLLVYLVRHSRHAISLKEHLSKHGHLVRELSIGDKNKSVLDYTRADYVALWTWLKGNASRIVRLRVLNGTEPHNIVALLGFIGAIPFGSEQHRQFTLSKCTGKVVTMLQKTGYNPFSGWQFPFLGLFNPNIWSPNKLRGELTSDWVERLHVINPPRFESRTWPRLRVVRQEGTSSPGLPSGDGPIPRSNYPVLQRITPFRYDVPLPTGLDKLPSQCTEVLRELCRQNHGPLDAIWWGTRPRPAMTIFEEIKMYPKMCWTSIGNAETVRVLDIRSLTMDRPSVPPLVRQFFDVIALETPIFSLEYLQISAYPSSTNPHSVDVYFTPARLMAIPDRFPNLRFLLIENIQHLNDALLIVLYGLLQFTVVQASNKTALNSGTTHQRMTPWNEITCAADD